MDMKLAFRSYGVLLAVAALTGCHRASSPGTGSPTSSTSLPTFNRDIAPILFRQCAPCHRPGEVAPFSVLDYREVRSHARQIATVTKSQLMPPWLPERGYG